MYILIADDEPLARSRLRRLLIDAGINAEISEAACVAEARQLAAKKLPDLVLLDISMPGDCGLTLAEEFATLPEPPAVIFVTAYPQHALAAFNVHPVDYLLKPVSASQLQRSLQRAAQLNRLQKQQPEEATVSFQQAGLHKSISLSQVLYFAAEDKYVQMYLKDQTILMDQSLNQLAELYPSLIRIHRKTLINPSHLTAIRQPADGPCIAELDHGTHKLAISRRALTSVRRALNQR